METVGGNSPRAFADALKQARARTNAKCDCLFSLERVWNCDFYRAGDGVHRAWLERRQVAAPFFKRWTRAFNRKHGELLALEARLFSAKDVEAGAGAGGVIANSNMVKQEILQHYPYPAERIHVIYNGLPPRPQAKGPEGQERLEGLRARVRRELGLSELDYVLLFAGSGWERKGLQFAIEGMRRANLSRPLLLVAGRGDANRFPRSSRVRFLGPVREMEAYYAAADAFLLPTLYDPFSNACLEALAAGLPVITTTANGFSEIVHPGEQGEVLDDPTDTEAVARAIEAWSNPERRADIRPQLLELASKFDMETNVRATLAVITASRRAPEPELTGGL